jgi:hypothetical protein
MQAFLAMRREAPTFTLKYTRRARAPTCAEGEGRTFRPVSAEPVVTPPVVALSEASQPEAEAPVVVATAVQKRTPRRHTSDDESDDNESDDNESDDNDSDDNDSDDNKSEDDGDMGANQANEEDNCESDDDTSAYEKQRLQNIEENKRKLKSIGLEPKPNPPPKEQVKRRQANRRREHAVVPGERSSERVAKQPRLNYSENAVLIDARKRERVRKRPASAVSGSAATATDGTDSEGDEAWVYEEVNPRDKRRRDKRPRVTPQHTKEKGNARCRKYRNGTGQRHIENVLGAVTRVNSMDVLMMTYRDRQELVDPFVVREFITRVLEDLREMIPMTMAVPDELIWPVIHNTSLTDAKKRNLIRRAQEMNIAEPEQFVLLPAAPAPRSVSAPVPGTPVTRAPLRARGPVMGPLP